MAKETTDGDGGGGCCCLIIVLILILLFGSCSVCIGTACLSINDRDNAGVSEGELLL